MAESASVGFNYLIISDLHLQEAEKNPAGRLFYFDQEFADFLRCYRVFYVGEHRWRLIIAGDFIEFYHRINVQPKPDEKLLGGVALTPTDLKFFPGSEWPKSVWKLDLILRSHPQLLLALARFVLAGNEIYILRGNHDLEFFWPEVQRHFRQLVTEHHPVDKSYLETKAAAWERIHFVPWFYLEKDLLYVEHGHQYDPYCSNSHNLYPVLPSNPRQLELALSAFTMCYFVARMQHADPASMENVGSIPKYLTHLIRNNWTQIAVIPLYYLEMLVRTLGKVQRLDPGQELSIDQMETKFRDEIKAAYGVPDETLRTLEQLSLAPVLLSWWKTIKCFYLDLLVVGAAALVLSIRLPSYPGPLGRWGPPLVAVLVLGALVLLGKRRIRSFNDHRNLREIARTIRDTVGCRYVVFGHSHDPDVHSLSKAMDQCYFNVGTWVPKGGEGQFIYLEILTGQAGPSAHLMRWDRRAQRPEELDPARYAKGPAQRKALLKKKERRWVAAGKPTPAA